MEIVEKGCSQVFKIDKEERELVRCPRCDVEMVLRSKIRWRKEHWGCPQCKGMFIDTCQHEWSGNLFTRNYCVKCGVLKEEEK